MQGGAIGADVPDAAAVKVAEHRREAYIFAEKNAFSQRTNVFSQRTNLAQKKAEK